MIDLVQYVYLKDRIDIERGREGVILRLTIDETTSNIVIDFPLTIFVLSHVQTKGMKFHWIGYFRWIGIRYDYRPWVVVYVYFF